MNLNFLRKFANVVYGNAISALIFSIFFVIAANSLSIFQFGVLAILYTLSLLLADLSDFGTGAHALLNSSFPSEKSGKNRFQILSRTRFTFFVSLCPLLPISYCFNFTTFLWVMSVFTCSYGMSLRILLQTDLRCQGKYSQLGACQILDRSVTLFLFLGIRPETANQTIFIIALSNLSTLIFFRWKPRFRYSLVESFNFYKQSISLGISSVLSDLALLDILLLASLRSTDEVANYSFVVRFCAPILLIGASLSLVTVKEFDVDFKRDGGLLNGLRRLFILTLGACLPLSVVMYFSYRYITAEFLNGKYGDKQILLVAALLGSLFLVFWQTVAAILQSQLMFTTNLKFALFIALSYLSAVILLADLAGELAIPVAQISVYIVAVVFGFHYLLRFNGKELN